MTRMRRPVVKRWEPGNPLTAEQLNETVDGVNQALGTLAPARGNAEAGVHAEVSDDDTVGLIPAELWTWVASETRTVRIEDDDDSSIYVDVQITRSVTVRKPSGDYVKIELEDPENG